MTGAGAVPLDTDATTGIRLILAKAASEKRHLLEPEAYQMLGFLGLPTPRHKWAMTLTEAEQAFLEVGAPVVIKIVSPEILHKSDVGGVRLNVQDLNGVRQAWTDLQGVAASTQAQFMGVLVVSQAKGGTEMIVGAMRDEEFGPVVMVGPGGILVEILREPTFFVAPTTVQAVLPVLSRGVLGRLMGGERGRKPVDKAALSKLVSRISELIARYPEVSEVDLNPVVLYPSGLAILDARVMLAN